MTKGRIGWMTLMMIGTTFDAAQANEPAEVTTLPALTVSGAAWREDAPVGPNQQPGWTTDGRLSATTRAYVLPPWHVELTQWWRPETPRGEDTEHLFQEEIEIGLPYRFQLDLYENWQISGANRVRHAGNQVEVRWALADWGKIPLNPTLYAEWKFNNGVADAAEFKLLLTQPVGRRWHWGMNFTYEQQVGDERETELAINQAISYTLLDEKLAVGLEMKFEYASERGERSDPGFEFLIGPSFEWKPTQRTTLNLVPLFGTTHDSPHLEAFVTFSIGFGRESDEGGRAPVSLKGD